MNPLPKTGAMGSRVFEERRGAPVGVAGMSAAAGSSSSASSTGASVTAGGPSCAKQRRAAKRAGSAADAQASGSPSKQTDGSSKPAGPGSGGGMTEREFDEMEKGDRADLKSITAMNDMLAMMLLAQPGIKAKALREQPDAPPGVWELDERVVAFDKLFERERR